MSKTYRLFISHSWHYSNAYEKLKSLLDNYEGFSYIDYSVPKNDPIHTSGKDQELYEAIRNHISSCHCVLILAGVYSSYSRWIDKEIKICTSEFSSKKPIVAIEPWGSEKTSKKVKDNADRIVKWNKASIVKAICEVGL